MTGILYNQFAVYLHGVSILLLHNSTRRCQCQDMICELFTTEVEYLEQLVNREVEDTGWIQGLSSLVLTDLIIVM